MSAVLREYSTVGNIHLLREADFTEAQAEAVARIIEQQTRIIQENKVDVRELATKGDVRETELRLQKEIETVKLELQKQIETVKLELQKDIALVESKLIKWLLGVGIASVVVLCGATFTMLKLMLH